MNFDFAALLVFLVFLTGIIWGLDIMIWKRRRLGKAERIAESSGQSKLNQETINQITREPRAVEYARSFFPVILIVLLLRSFLVEPFRIPSNSMMPTLLTGDFILVNKFSYGIRLPVLNAKVINISEPERGDVVVFRYPKDPSVDYIKRLIGKPGDHIEYRDKKLFINGQPMKQEYIGSYRGVGSGISMTGDNLFVENLGADVNHQILIDTRRQYGPSDMQFDVPKGHYFVMGDNRDNSNDSRFWGFVPEANLVGRAFMIWMNWDQANSGVAWNRIGSRIK